VLSASASYKDECRHSFAFNVFLQDNPDLVEGAVKQVEKRYEFSYQDTWPAAYLVDPINFQKTPGIRFAFSLM
jgi:hypothetical protein